MHKDGKLKRSQLRQLLSDIYYAKDEKSKSQKAMERFKAVPYQLEYQRKYGGKRDE
ncbi:MAG: hypothetical protein ACI4DK_12725 [Lachnospiraceae bacterium]